jgi:hypothetical protein
MSILEMSRKEPGLKAWAEEHLYVTWSLNVWFMLLTLPLSFAISVSGLGAQQVLSATSFTLLTNINKIPVILFSVLIFHDKMNFRMATGLAMALGFAYVYAREVQKYQDELKMSNSNKATDGEKTPILTQTKSDIESGALRSESGDASRVAV